MWKGYISKRLHIFENTERKEAKTLVHNYGNIMCIYVHNSMCMVYIPYNIILECRSRYCYGDNYMHMSKLIICTGC